MPADVVFRIFRWPSEPEGALALKTREPCRLRGGEFGRALYGPTREGHSPRAQGVSWSLARTRDVNAYRTCMSKLLTVEETAERLGIGKSTLYPTWKALGLTPYRVGDRLRFRDTDLEAWMDAQRAAA
jgi:excisionase family DNA binding protein